jgi:hypothetical protein
VLIRNEACISCKIKQETGEKQKCILLGPWIKSLVGQNLGMIDEFKAQQGLFMKILCDMHPIGKFTLSLTTKIVGFSLMNEEKQFVFMQL